MAGLEPGFLQLDGKNRRYELYVPLDLDPGTPAPLVVALHRLLESGKAMAYMTGFNTVADREGFIVVYPNGPGQHWDTFGGEVADDVRLILAVIDDVAAKHRIDRDRVYVTGASNGGFMTYVLACEAPGTFAAAAPVMGLMQESLAQKHANGPAVPILIIHGTRDILAPYDAHSVLGEEMFTVDEAVAYWVRRNSCNSTPTVVDLEDRDPRDGTRVTVERYVGLKAPVELYRIKGGGHTWPGGREPGLGLVTGRISKDIEASDVIWEFFERHRR